MDIIDDAQAREAQYLATCLANARATGRSRPQERNTEGRVVCAECGELIPAQRLAAVPGVTRCTRCQQDREKETHGGRQ